MAGEVKCGRCHRVVVNEAASIEEVFGNKRPGVRFMQCKDCREGYQAQYYQNHQARIRADNQAWKALHREEIRQRNAEKVACELCGRVVTRYKLKPHQATRLCEKRRPPTEN